MELTKELITKIDLRIEALYKAIDICPSYLEENILDKIRCRIMQAEIQAFKEIKSGKSVSALENSLKWCIDNEQYSGAEGIKRVLSFAVNELKQKNK